MSLVRSQYIPILAFLAAILVGCTDRGVTSTEPMTHSVIVESAVDYTAWPAVARLGDNSIIILYTNSDEHMGPNGRIEGVRSTDEGRSWSDPFTVYDTLLDERESGLTMLSDGSVLAHIWSTLHTPESYAAMGPGSYRDTTVQRWVDVVSTVEYASATDLAGSRILRSTDGLNWEEVGDGPDSIHGGIELNDGRIMVASYKESRDFATIHEADDWSGPWRQIAEVHSPQPDSLRFGEPSIAQMPSGRIVVMMRTTTKPYNDADDRCFLWLVYSDDGGATWSDPKQTPLWGFPPHLLLLESGQLLVTYGHRRSPFGQRAAISDDGITWDPASEIVLRDDAPNKDLGYPASIQLKDGRVLTVYYQSHESDTLRPPEGPLPDRHKPDIWTTIWSPGD